MTLVRCPRNSPVDARCASMQPGSPGRGRQGLQDKMTRAAMLWTSVTKLWAWHPTDCASRHAARSREPLRCWLATAMAVMSMEAARADPDPEWECSNQIESSMQSTWPVAALAMPVGAAVLCTLYLSSKAKCACDLTRMHTQAVCFIWLAVMAAMAVSTWYIAAGKHDMLHLLLNFCAGAGSVVLILQFLNQSVLDTRRGHIIGTWLQHGVKKSWPNSEEALVSVHNSLDKVRALANAYDESVLTKAALNIAPLKWQRDILGDDVWLEVQETSLDVDSWRGAANIVGTILFDHVGHCIQAMHKHLCDEWEFEPKYVFPKLWILKSRQHDLEATVDAAINETVGARIVWRLGIRKMWLLFCLLMPCIGNVLCSTDGPVLKDDHDGLQFWQSPDENVSPVGRMAFFLNCTIFFLMAWHSGTSHYALWSLLALGHMSMPLLQGIPSLVVALALLVITCGRIAPPSQDTTISWAGITIEIGADKTIDRYDEVLISFAMLHRKGELSVHVRDVHVVKRRVMCRFGKHCLDQIRGALERAERKVSGGAMVEEKESVVAAELVDLQNCTDFDKDAYEFLLFEVRNLVKMGTPCEQDVGCSN
eukprot:evm.model.scf_4852.1 EVM.evm.TU.scf_4852.1   scf_4852:2128-4354(-)